MPDKISIVIPNWNGKEKLQKNLPKVLEVEGFNEIIVVDDASTDDSVFFLRENYSEKIKIIDKKQNTGFGSNVNTGVKFSQGNFVFLLNTDAVPEKDCLRKAMHYFKDPLVFSVSFNTGGNWSWAKWENGWFRHYQADGKEDSHETMWASGGSSIFRKSIWEELEGFDPLFDPFYVEDLDLGYRALKRGYKNIWDANAKVEHKKETGVIAQNFKKERIEDISERNMLIFIWKNISGNKLIKEHKIALVKRLFKNPKFFLIFLRALFKLDQILIKRGVEKKNSKVTDMEILGKFSQEKL